MLPPATAQLLHGLPILCRPPGLVNMQDAPYAPRQVNIICSSSFITSNGLNKALNLSSSSYSRAHSTLQLISLVSTKTPDQCLSYKMTKMHLHNKINLKQLEAIICHQSYLASPSKRHCKTDICSHTTLGLKSSACLFSSSILSTAAHMAL